MKVMVIVMERVSIQLKFNVIVIVIQCITSSWPQVCIIYDLNTCQLRSYWIHLKLGIKAHTTS